MSDKPKRVRDKKKEFPLKQDGTPKALQTDGTVDNRGGNRPGPGRKPKIKHLSNYHKALKMFDDNIEAAIQVLVDSFTDDDVNVRIRAAEIFLKKTISDKKTNEVTGPGGGPIQVTKAEWKEAVEEIDDLIGKRIKKKAIEVEYQVEEDK